jgi:hypothetical protein
MKTEDRHLAVLRLPYPASLQKRPEETTKVLVFKEIDFKGYGDRSAKSISYAEADGISFLSDTAAMHTAEPEALAIDLRLVFS